jgi:hypothetical protein
MFRSKLENYFYQQKQRMINVTHNRELVEKLFDDLQSKEYGPVDIDERCCNELKTVLLNRYDDVIQTTRLQGYGWTRAHIEDHMKRYLNAQLREAVSILKTGLKESDASLELE